MRATPATNNGPKAQQRIQPLTTQFFSRLIKLETDFLSKKYTAETLDELTQYYADAVEYYDSIKDHISSYFIYKIQDALATKQSLKLLIRENAKVNNSLVISTDGKDVKDSEDLASTPSTAGDSPNKVPTNASGRGKGTHILPAPHAIPETIESSEDDDEEEEEKYSPGKQNVTVGRAQRKSRRQSFGTLKTVKQKIFAHTMNIESQKKNAKQNLTQTLNAFGDSVQSNDVVVRSDIDTQKNKILERVAKKRGESMMKSMMNHTQSSIGFLQQPSASKGGADNMENLLKELDDQDSSKSFGNNEHAENIEHSQKSLFNVRDNPSEENNQQSQEDDFGKSEEKKSDEHDDQEENNGNNEEKGLEENVEAIKVHQEEITASE